MNKITSSEDKDTIKVFTDGASRGNPGDAGIGVLIINSNGKITELKKYLGRKTNNQAEYSALILALEHLQKTDNKEIIIHTDSQLVANQMNGKWRVKDEGLKELNSQARKLAIKLDNLTVTYIPRNQNKEADRLANEAINEYFND